MATREIKLNGVVIKAGERVQLRYDSANRDESRAPVIPRSAWACTAASAPTWRACRSRSPTTSCSSFPTATALENADTGETTTWSELERRVARLAGELTEGRGIAKGDRVAYFAGDTPLTFAVLLACTRVGAIFVPLNRRLSAAELETLTRDAGPRLLLHDDAWRTPARSLAAATAVVPVDVADAEFGQPRWAPWRSRLQLIEILPADFGDVLGALRTFANPILTRSVADQASWNPFLRA